MNHIKILLLTILGNISLLCSAERINYLQEVKILSQGVEDVSPQLIPYTSSIETINNGSLSLPAGVYDMQMSIFIPDTTTISKIYTQIVVPFTNLVWDLSRLSKGKWVNISQKIILSQDVNNSSFKLYVNNLPEFGGGKGSIYIDDIQFIWNNEDPVNIAIHPIKFKLYPNPAKNILNIESEKLGTCIIYNLRGQIVKTFMMDSYKMSLVVEDFKPGLYLLQIKTNDSSGVHQLVVQ